MVTQRQLFLDCPHDQNDIVVNSTLLACGDDVMLQEVIDASEAG